MNATTKERPLLITTQEVQNVQAGIQTQIRRVMKLQPNADHHRGGWVTKLDGKNTKSWAWHRISDPLRVDSIECPFGQVGDVLWVKETWMSEWIAKKANGEWLPVETFFYKADGDPNDNPVFDKVKWRSSVQMPKEACRLRLLITDIRVQRLQEISYQDAKSQGVEMGVSYNYKDYLTGEYGLSPYRSFATLWDKINGKDSWNTNPYTWAITFKLI